MKPYHKIKNVKFIDDKLFLTIDGRIFHSMFIPFQKLLNASKVERKSFRISPSGYEINWPLLDEDISIDGLLKLVRSSSFSKK